VLFVCCLFVVVVANSLYCVVFLGVAAEGIVVLWSLFSIPLLSVVGVVGAFLVMGFQSFACVCLSVCVSPNAPCLARLLSSFVRHVSCNCAIGASSIAGAV
jgi:hypothetical protein